MKQHFVVTALASMLIAALPVMSAPANQYAQAVANFNSGNYQQAATEFESLKATFPNNVLTHYYLARCHQALGHVDQAKQEYEWVTKNGDGSLKGLAVKGMAGLSGAKVSKPVARKKVKKILEFYADW